MKPNKLNLGCGKNHYKDFWNVDITRNVSPDEIVPDFTSLPYKDNEFKEVICEGALPYIPRNDLQDVLKEICRVCSGIATIKVGHYLGEPALTELYMTDCSYGFFSLEGWMHLDTDNLIKNNNLWMVDLFKYPDYFKIHNIEIKLNANNHRIVKIIEGWVNKSYRNQRKYQRLFLSRIFTPRCMIIKISKKIK